MEKVGIITANNTLWQGLKNAAHKRGVSLFRVSIDNLKKYDNNMPDVLLMDFPKRDTVSEDLLENFCIENPEILIIVIGDKIESTFIKSYSYIVMPRVMDNTFIMDMVVNTLAYKTLLLKEAQRHQKVIDFDKKDISNSRRHKELLIARNGELLIQKERLQRERERFSNGTGEIIEFLLRLIEYQKPALANHSRFVAKVAVKLGIECDMGSDELLYLEWAALLHDIGKLEGETIIEDINAIKRHAVLGEALLSKVDLLRPIAQIVRSHHERFDGTGFPDKLSGDEIPIESRIIAICNTLASTTNDGKTENNQETAKELIIKSGFALDPELVDLLLENLGDPTVFEDDEYTVVRAQELEEGMTLFENIYTSQGLFLVPAGKILTMSQIEKIQRFNSIAPIIGGVKIKKENTLERSNGGRKQA